jgi:hypothetical protein
MCDNRTVIQPVERERVAGDEADQRQVEQEGLHRSSARRSADEDIIKVS